MQSINKSKIFHTTRDSYLNKYAKRFIQRKEKMRKQSKKINKNTMGISYLSEPMKVQFSQIFGFLALSFLAFHP